jgi:hypothetical protein
VSPSSPRLGRLIIAFNPAPPHSEPIACSDRPRPDGFCRNRSRCARLFPRWKSSVASALAAAVCCRRRLWVPSGPLHNWLDPAAGQRSGACERANMTTPKIREPMWARERMSTCAQPSHPTDELAKSGPYGCHDRYIGTIPKAGPEAPPVSACRPRDGCRRVGQLHRLALSGGAQRRRRSGGRTSAGDSGDGRYRGTARVAPGRLGRLLEPAPTRGCFPAAGLMPPVARSGHCAGGSCRRDWDRAKRASCQLLDVAQNQTGRISEHGGGTPPRQCRRDGCSRVLVRSDRNLSTARRPSRSAVSIRAAGHALIR